MGGSGEEQERGSACGGFLLGLPGDGDLLHLRPERVGLSLNGRVVLASTPVVEWEVLGLWAASAKDRELGVWPGVPEVLRSQRVVPGVPVEGAERVLGGIDAH